MHHEDIRRAQPGWEPRQLPTGVQDALCGRRCRAPGAALVAAGRRAGRAPPHRHRRDRDAAPGATRSTVADRCPRSCCSSSAATRCASSTFDGRRTGSPSCAAADVSALALSGPGGRRRRAPSLTSPIAQRAEVEDGGGQHGVGAGVDRGREVLDRARRRREAITGIGDLAAYGADQLEVEAVLGAVGVHRVEQDLAGAELGRPRAPTRPRRARRTCRPPWVVTSKPESVPGRPAGVDRQHQHLVAEPVGDLGDQLGPVDRGGVDRDLVGAGAQQPVDVVDARTLRRRR